tara:strand:+ start:5 stop:205 length:201 start_codon:yes stop_codon:yes gene_type:complete
MVDQVVAEVTTNQAEMELQIKDMVVQMHTSMLTRVVVEQVVLLKHDPPLNRVLTLRQVMEDLVFRT